MFEKESLRKKLKDGKVVFGTFIGIKDPAVIEIMSLTGFDFVIAEMEHTTNSTTIMDNMIRAGEATNISVIVRAAEDYSTILKVLDFGADGILFPHVKTKEQAQELVNKAKYYPIGKRGMDGTTRSAKFGLENFKEHMQRCNDNIIVGAMIEDKEAVDNIEEILSVEGLDLIFIGGFDLSGSLGVPSEVDSSIVQENIAKIINAVNRRNKICQGNKDLIKIGTPAFTLENIPGLLEKKIDMITSPPVDLMFLANQLKIHREKIKEFYNK